MTYKRLNKLIKTYHTLQAAGYSKKAALTCIIRAFGLDKEESAELIKLTAGTTGGVQ